MTFVNAPQLAEELGVQVEIKTTSESPNHRSVVSLRAHMADGTTAVASGALSGPNQVEKLIEVNGRHFDLRAQGNVLLRVDRPVEQGVLEPIGAAVGVHRQPPLTRWRDFATNIHYVT
ncbi:hypothetical protein GCM10027597_31950 [Saccharopolyspora tripterygii]